MKGQMEIVGLLMIVIIAAIVLVFSIVYVANNAPDPLIHETFGESVLSKNFVNVLAETDVPECNADYGTLVKDCASQYPRTGRITCQPAPGMPSSPTPDSCVFLQHAADQIINNSIGEWGLRYRYYVEFRNGTVIYERSNDCGPSDEKESPGRQPIPFAPYTNNAFIVLEICKT